jgi:hypothetical protein
MALDISGKVISILPEQSGSSSRGPWKKGGFVIETEGNFPKKVCCTVWGDMLNQVNNLKQGETVKASIDLESREYNERWYTDVRAWRIESVTPSQGDTPPQGGSSESASYSSGPQNAAPGGEDSADDLPF